MSLLVFKRLIVVTVLIVFLFPLVCASNEAVSSVNSTNNRSVRKRKKNKGYMVSGEEIKKIILEYIQDRTGISREDIKIGEFRNRKIFLSGPDYTAYVSERGKKRTHGKSFLLINFKNKGKRTARVYIRVPVRIRVDFVTIVSEMSAGTILKREDLAVTRNWVEYSDQNFIVFPEDVIGKRLKKNIKAMDILYSKFVEKVPYVKKGDYVSIVARKGRLNISAKGILKNNADQGDIVKVMNVSSRKILFARVFNKKTVIVDF